MKTEGSSRKLEIWTLVVNCATAIATTVIAATALTLQMESSSTANSIAKQSVDVAKISTDLQLKLDSLAEERKEPRLILHRAAGTKTEFIYTLQNTGEKDAVILELDFDPTAGTNELVDADAVVALDLQNNDFFRHTIDLSTLPLALRYELGVPIIVSPGGVVQIRLKVAASIPYGVLHAVYNDLKRVELSNTHINRNEESKE